MGPFRQIPIAWRMLADKPSRLAFSMLGVAFSVVIMFMELGFFNGTNDSSANLPPFFACDLILSHREKNHLKTGEEFPHLWLQQVRSVPGVGAAVKFNTQAGYWWNPQDRTRNRVLMIGVDLDQPMFSIPAIAAHRAELRLPETVLYDRLSRHDLGRIETGTRTQVDSTPARVVGLFALGPNFTYEGHLIMGLENFQQVSGQAENVVDLGLIRLAPGADVEAVRRAIAARLPAQALLLTPQEILRREILVTTQRSPAGIVFGIGLLVGFAIGTIICYQILFNEVNDHLPQFATMKAMGHPPSFISGIVRNEALLLSLAGYLPGLAASVGIYALIEHFTQIRMFLTGPRALLVLVLTSGMCLLAARFAVKRVHATDPADLF
jgi:putative ABC transport system permease protein